VSNSLNISTIGTIHSPYKEKFAIPRQPSLVPAAKAIVEIPFEYCPKESLNGIEQYSHLWLIFCFHATQQQGWKPLVRPPRLGGNEKLGVLATRSTFRPNPIGMSVVKFEKVTYSATSTLLHVSGIDLLDKTPILDIKPYLPYVDSIEQAQAGFAQHAPETPIKVTFSEQAQQTIAQQSQAKQLTELISQVLAQDPRPAYKKNKADDKVYGMRLHNFNIRWQFTQLDEITVLELELEQDIHE